MSRNAVLLTGLIGLVGAVAITAISLLVIIFDWIPILISRPLYVWLLFLFLAFFSVVEIPLMIYTIRRIVASENPKAKYVAWVTNVGYALFGAVYASPFILLTGRLGVGSALAALSFVRFLTAIFLLPAQEK